MLNKEEIEFLRKQIFDLLVLEEKISKSEIVKRFNEFWPETLSCAYI